MEYIIAMKSGAKFVVGIKDYDVFKKDMGVALEASTGSTRVFWAIGNFTVDILDISAIYPRSSEVSSGSE